MMIDRHLWIPSTTENDPEDKMLWASSRISTTRRTEPCPFCNDCNLRFYYHEFNLESKPNRRGTLWVWCAQCHLWSHISGVALPDNVLNTGVLSDDEIDECEKKLRLLDWLNHYWEEERIPHTFDVA
jgi:hypothetical protein